MDVWGDDQLDVVSVVDVVRQGCLQWFCHLERRGKDEWVFAGRNVSMTGEKGSGRVKKT